MSQGGRRPRAACRGALLVILGFAAALAAGCIDGQPPYEVIPQAGDSEDFLPPPPVGVAPGITHDVGLIYRFDRGRYRLFEPLPGTEPRFIWRDSVLAKAEAALPGANQQLLYRPDLSDPRLAWVYSNPRLFGFAPAALPDTGFVDGRRVTDWGADRYLPTQVGNWWESNHLDEWKVLDSLVAPESQPPTAVGMPLFRVLERCENVVPGIKPYQPGVYLANVIGTASPGAGILFHAWDLVSEREYKPDPNASERLMQRNPRFLWLSSQSLGFSQDPQASPPVTVDQCLDNLSSHLNLFPVRMCGDQIQEGDIFTTWTYLEVPTDVLRARLDSEAQLERGGRCGQPIVAGRDTLTMFPTRTFRILCKFEARTERIVDQVELKRLAETIGLYPVNADPAAVVQFRVTMSILRGPLETTVQFLELWYLKDIGQVIRRQGLNPRSRTSARLKRCFVNGVLYESSNPVFYYHD